MFADITPRYDLLNHLLSFNIDRGWRKALMASIAPVLMRSEARVLDLCCGSGDVLLDLQKQSGTRALGADFCHPMLVLARHKARQRGLNSLLVEADALELPVRDSSLDAITIAFGFRNLANYESGLRECCRVLTPGGVLAILEFSHPESWLVKIGYGLYSRVLLPLVGGVISGSKYAYSYLPDSIRKFPKAEQLRQMMTTAGFVDTSFELLTGGIASLHVGRKSARGGASE